MTDPSELCQFDSAAYALGGPGGVETSLGCTRKELYLLTQEGNPVSWRLCADAARHVEGAIRTGLEEDTHPNVPVPVLTLLELEDEP